MRTIQVDPAQIDACAARMEASNQEYLQCVTKLFATVDMMQRAWSGKDNLAFTAEIQKFEGDFRQMSLLCSYYVDFLRSSSRAYQDTQDELTVQANRIVV